MKNNAFNFAFLVVLLFNGLLWLRSGYGKVAGGSFANGLGDTLTRFASKNPYPWYRDFLNSVAIPNSQIFGYLVMIGETFAAVSLIGTAVYLMLQKKTNKPILVVLLLGLVVGAMLNATFWLASGWTSPSTDGLNLLMFVVQSTGAVIVLRNLALE